VLTAGPTWPQFPKGCCHASYQQWLHTCCMSTLGFWVAAGRPSFHPRTISSDSVSITIWENRSNAPTPLPPGALSPDQAGRASTSVSALPLALSWQPLHLRAAVLCAAIASSSGKPLAAYLLIQVTQLLELVRVLPLVATSEPPCCVP